jgi:hypothetical protein
MDELRGIELRYALVVLLLDRGQPTDVKAMVAALEAGGRRLAGRPGKAVSDALRWEVRRGRVVRLGRGRYAPGRMPRSTEWYIRRRLASAMRTP